MTGETRWTCTRTGRTWPAYPCRTQGPILRSVGIETQAPQGRASVRGHEREFHPADQWKRSLGQLRTLSPPTRQSTDTHTRLLVFRAGSRGTFMSHTHRVSAEGRQPLLGVSVNLSCLCGDDFRIRVGEKGGGVKGEREQSARREGEWGPGWGWGWGRTESSSVCPPRKICWVSSVFDLDFA